MGGDYDYYNSISYPQPYNIPIPEDLNFHNPAAEYHAIMKGHVAAKHEARRKFRERQKSFDMEE
jgi:hypothetical protein